MISSSDLCDVENEAKSVEAKQRESEGPEVARLRAEKHEPQANVLDYGVHTPKDITWRELPIPCSVWSVRRRTPCLSSDDS